MDQESRNKTLKRLKKRKLSEKKHTKKFCKNIQYDEKKFFKYFNKMDWSLLNDDRMYKILSTFHEIVDLRIQNGDNDKGNPVDENQRQPYPELWLSDSEYSSSNEDEPKVEEKNENIKKNVYKIKNNCKNLCQSNYGSKIIIGNLSFFISPDDDPLLVDLSKILHIQTTPQNISMSEMMIKIKQLFNNDTQRYLRALHRIDNLTKKVIKEQHEEVAKLILSIRPLVSYQVIPKSELRDPQTVPLAKLIGRSLQSEDKNLDFYEYGREAMVLFDYNFERFVNVFKEIQEANKNPDSEKNELIYINPTLEMITKSEKPSSSSSTSLLNKKNKSNLIKPDSNDPLFSPTCINKRSVQPNSISIQEMNDLLNL